MTAIDIEALRGLINAAVTGISVLGGAMAYFSGYAASKAVLRQAAPDTLSQEINEGLATGFGWGVVLACLAFIIVV